MTTIAPPEDMIKLDKAERLLKSNGLVQRCRIALAPKNIQDFHRDAKALVDRTPGATGVLGTSVMDVNGGNSRQQFGLAYSAKKKQTYAVINPDFAGPHANKFHMRIFK